MSQFVGIIAFKGGVGKTVLTSVLGVGLSLKGKRVLLIDLDPQANLSEVFLTDRLTKSAYEEYVVNGRQFSIDYILDPSKSPLILRVHENLYLLPSHYKYMLDYTALSTITIDKASLIRGSLGKISSDLSLDYIIIDFPPQMYQLVTPIASASVDYFITPVSRGAFTIKSVNYLIKTFYKTSQMLGNRLSTFLGAVLNRFDVRDSQIISEFKKRVESEIYDAFTFLSIKVNDLISPVFNTVLYYNPILTKISSPGFGNTPYLIRHLLGKYKGKYSITLERKLVDNINKLVDEFEERLKRVGGR
ncbi:MAG: ParA family protein [Sulfolobaceae archaeon]